MTLVSYTPKKRRNVILLSTQHLGEGDVNESDRAKKPEIISQYNRTKGAVDCLDKLVRTYSCQRKSNRWPMVLFQNFLDIAAYNALVIFTNNCPDFENGKSQSGRLFLERLGKDLCAPAVQMRQQIPPQPLPALRAIESSTIRRRVRCSRCPSNVDKKTTEVCAKCQMPICKLHSVMVCNFDCQQ